MCSFAKMLGFIDHDRERSPIADCLLHGVSVVGADSPGSWHEAEWGFDWAILDVPVQLI